MADASTLDMRGGPRDRAECSIRSGSYAALCSRRTPVAVHQLVALLAGHDALHIIAFVEPEFARVGRRAAHAGRGLLAVGGKVLVALRQVALRVLLASMDMQDRKAAEQENRGDEDRKRDVGHVGRPEEGIAD
ncbi:hypothetical protein ebA6192 [Aromatoleum aromaticum EbN1]|uniref:Uncharacterized protein n=1 Tax=Aromatoleum aromaticum (strain DSM 19018 / LMG 30748 / EbN1) TaxID=76114 RepID=Q5NZ52_AROAE|nr:hypothetical protein ebA6192 [Aromatoleum aromaticum EbN1]